jgi:RHS repeat-associated protein
MWLFIIPKKGVVIMWGSKYSNHQNLVSKAFRSSRVTGLRLILLLLSVGLIIAPVTVLAAQRTAQPTVRYSTGSNIYPDLGSLISNYNAAWQTDYSECMASGNPDIGFACTQKTITGSTPYGPEPFGIRLTNGLPAYYMLTVLTHTEYISSWQPPIVSESESESPIIVTQGCPADYGSQFSGPPENRTLVCTKTESQSCESAGNPINVATGCKFEYEVDYATADGVLKVERRYIDQRSGWSIDDLRHLIVLEPGAVQPSSGVLTGGGKLNCPDVVLNQWQRYQNTVDNPFGSESYDVIRCLNLINPGSERVVHVWQAGQHTRYIGSGDELMADGLMGLKSRLLVIDPLLNDGAAWKLVAGSGDIHYFLESGTLAWTDLAEGGRLEYTFGPQGLLTKTDQAGRTLTYVYDEDDRLVAVTLPDGNQIIYEYGTEADTIDYELLHKVIWPDGGSVEYLYNEPQHLTGQNSPLTLTGKLDAEGNRIGTYKYSSGKAVSTEGALGTDKKTIQDYSLYIYLTDALGTRHTLYYNKQLADGMKLLTRTNQPAGSGSAAAYATIDYTTSGLVKERRDFNGNKTQYGYDEARGLETVKIEGIPSTSGADYRPVGVALPAGVIKTSTEWHNQWRKPVKVAKSGLLTTYVYNGDADPFDSNQTANCSPAVIDGQSLPVLCRLVQQATTDTNGAQGLSATLDPAVAARHTLYSYNERGQLLSESRTPEGVIRTIEYYETTTADYAIGDIKRVINALGHITTFNEYNDNGYPLRVTDPNGTETLLLYDERNRLVTQTIDGATITHIYDLNGNRTSSQLPNGVVVAYHYDEAQRMVGIEDGAGNKIEYELDAEGNLLEERIKDDAGSLTYIREQVFDALSRLMQVVDTDDNIEVHTYDKNGNPTGITAPNSATTTQVFDTQDRLNRIIDPQNGSTAPTIYNYDGQGNLTSVTDPKGNVTTYTYNGFGEVITQSSPNTGTTTYTYDAVGNRITQTDARNITVTYTYDALNRLTGIAYPDSTEDVTYTYDQTAGGNYGIGRLTQIDDHSGSTQYQYDRRGNIVQVTTTIDVSGQSRVFTTGYAYDLADNLMQITYPDARTVDYTRNSIGQIVEVETTFNSQTQTLADTIGYQPFGPLSGLTYGNNLVQNRVYDLDSRLDTVSTAGIQSLDYGYDLNSNIDEIDNLIDTNQSQSYVYDLLDRLSEADGGYGEYDYSYDGVGNRLTEVLDSQVENYTYALNSQRLLERVIPAQAGIQYQYDNTGNTTTIDSDTFTYNDANRLETATVASLTTTYRYNALGQRVLKTNTNETVLYLYDLNGQLLAEADAQGVINTEYAWLDNQPLAHIDAPQNIVYYYHTDHLGTPQLMTDQSQQLVWQAYYAPFGDANITIDDVVNNLRFPGQYFDQETGLHYNYFRYYDPSTGRYITSDPIGLRGGLNTYAYVEGNPVMFVDPLGLLWGPGGGPKVGPFGSVCGSGYSATYIPDLMKQACENHDKCYGKCANGDANHKMKCDLQFYKDGGGIYFLAVHRSPESQKAYDRAQKEACKECDE